MALRARGANDPSEFLSGVGVLIENCKRNNLLDFRDQDERGEDSLSIAECLKELRSAAGTLERAGDAYIYDGGGSNRDEWSYALGRWVGFLEETTMLMHIALQEAHIEIDRSLPPVELVEIVPALH